MSLSAKEVQDVLDELAASRRSRQRAWENLQEIRWILKDLAGLELPLPKRKAIDLEGRIVKEGVKKALTERQFALNGLLQSLRSHRRFCEQPLTLRGADYAHASEELNKAVEQAEALLRQFR